MSKLKAVVLERSGFRYTVLGNDGAFRHVYRRQNIEVGEEIEVRTVIMNANSLRIGAGVAALFLLVLMACLGWNLYQAPTAVALLSVDINPSLQFTIDSQGRLLKFQSENDDAKSMLSQLDLKGQPLDKALEQIITQSYDHKFLNSQQNWVVVGYSPMSDKTSDQMPKELNDQQIALWVTRAIKKNGFTPQVAVFPLTSQERELAQQGELTLGEYALWQTAQKAGVETQAQKLKDNSERDRLLENPQVQEQIKTGKHGMESSTPQTNGNVRPDSGSSDQSNKETKGKLKPDKLPPSSGKMPGNDNDSMNNRHEKPQMNKGSNRFPGEFKKKAEKGTPNESSKG
ncbi:anti-sigma-I factor RsgI [Desulfosporosinus acididurans]|uniref:Anti-sigma-I factor RsgI n=1 Tax=Desulfosporosinus acididurans TaxID=476652 RepID=A0A0J1FW73_9FIRM|nr:anti-sigma factor domain-containing protein [Desulfosporosinus acididurans]KLU67669.1 anti-sigma-I factor RsgI [Desulfosporosinus acididurans]